MLVDNTETIKSVLQFDGSRYYYKFAVIVRRKDYPEDECPIINKEGRREVCIHQWLISSMKDYERLLSDMLKYTELFRARLYVTLDRKDLYKTLVYADTILRDAINGIALGQKDVSCKSFSKLVNSATSVKESNSKEGKCWLFDVDTHDISTLYPILTTIGEENILAILQTKAGVHVVVKKAFNAKIWDGILPHTEVKENALGLVAMY
jgi:hypothetical protein